MRKIIAFLILSVLLSEVAFTESSDSLAHVYLQQAQSLMVQSNRMERKGDFSQQARLADSAYLIVTEAKKLYTTLLTTQKDSLIQMNLLQSYRVFVTYHINRREPGKAETYIAQSFQLVQENYEDPEKWVFMCYLIQGDFYDRIGQTEKAIEAYQAFLDISEKYDILPSSNLSYYYRLVGQLYRSILDLDQSILNHQQGLQHSIRAFGPRHRHTATHYHHLALSYDQARFSSKAIEAYEQALDIRLEVRGKHHVDVAGLYLDIGVHYWREAQHEKAISYLHEALNIYRIIFQGNHIRIAGTLNNLGLVYDQQKKYDKAILYLDSALIMKQSLRSSKNTDLALAQTNLALAHLKKKQQSKGLILIHQAMAELIPDFNPDSVSSIDFRKLPSTHHYYLQNALLIWGMLIGEIGNPDVEQLFKANEIQQILIDLNQHRLQEFRFDGARARQQFSANQAYLSNLNVLYQLYQKTSDPSYLEQSYRLFEKAKAFLLRKMVQEGNILQTSGVPAAMIQGLDSLRKARIYYEQESKKATVQGKSSVEETVRLTSLTLSQQYDSLLSHIEANYPVFRQLQQEDPIAPLTEVQKTLDHNEAILTFWDGSQFQLGLNIMLIYPEGIRLYQQKIELDFWNQLQAYKEQISRTDFSLESFQEFSTFSHSLYQSLLAKPLQHLKEVGLSPSKLTFITDRHLNQLPFELFLTEMPDTSKLDYRNLPYLFRDYTINYAQSFSMWVDQMQVEGSSRQSYAGFAPSYDYEQLANSEELETFETFRSNPGKLQSIYEEVEFAHSLFGGQAYLREEATEQNFKRHRGSPAILHLAMHALADSKNSMRSKLIFSPTVDGEDGYLHGYEIYTMKLQTQLAVLSACETGKGKNMTAEGVYSLARAFTFAGCPSILTTFWQVNDKYTAALMNPFFTALHEGMEKPAALRQAKLSYLASTDQVGTHPANWAAFVHLGNDKAISMSQGSVWWLVGLLFLLILVSGVWYIRKYKA